MDERHRTLLQRTPWLRRALKGLALFTLGGLASFGYSFGPLHERLAWRSEALQERLEARSLENMHLADALRKLRATEAERIAPETLARVEQALATARATLDQTEKDLQRSERKRREANASAARWKKRFEEARSEVVRVRQKTTPVGITPDPPGERLDPAAPSPSTSGPGIGTLPPAAPAEDPF